MFEQLLATFGTLLTFMGWHPNICSVDIAAIPLNRFYRQVPIADISN
jgi:hypothetical protein